MQGILSYSLYSFYEKKVFPCVLILIIIVCTLHRLEINKMFFTPTDEQENCKEGFLKGGNMKIDACAGSGKTSTLNFLASSTDRNCLYLAFNKVSAEEARGKFPQNTTCRTTHSIAYGVVGYQYAEAGKLQRPREQGYVNVGGTAKEVGMLLKIPAQGQVTGIFYGMMAKKCLSVYECSSDEEISSDHVSLYWVREHLNAQKRKLGENKVTITENAVIRNIVSYAKKIWKLRIDLNSPVLAGHDTYLKLYQLSKPTLRYDVIFLDEAQDTTDCVLDIVLNQKNAQVVCVGNKRQAIYQWRGAVNAMQKLSYKTFTLSQSFRYGQDVADVANIIIGSNIKGNPKLDTKIVSSPINGKTCLLYRTNSALISHAIGLLEKGKKIKLEIDVKPFINKLESAIALSKGERKNVKHEDIAIYENWDELVLAGEDDVELKRLAKLIKQGEAQNVVDMLKTYRDCGKDYDYNLTTAHKSKGREFDNVILGDDFPTAVDMDEDYNTYFKGLSEQEENLLYVACTRAQKTLQVNQTVREYIEHKVLEDEPDYEDDLDFLHLR